MRSKISYFNTGLFRKNITRFWPLWAGYMLTWLLVLTIPMANLLSYEWVGEEGVLAHIGYVGSAGGVILSFLFSILSAMAVFSYLYSSKSVGLIHALPVKRDGLFLSNFLSGFLWMEAAHVAVFLITVLVGAMYGAPNVSALLTWLGLVTMQTVFFYGFASFCAMLTSHLMVLPILYVLLNFTAVVLNFITNNLLGTFVFGMGGTMKAVLGPLSPAYQLVSRTQTGVQAGALWYDGWGLLGVYCVVGLVLAAAALLLYRGHRSESAADVISIPRLEPVFKYCFAAGCSIVLGTVIYSMAGGTYGTAYANRNACALMIVSMVVAGFIGYFAAEMLLKKTFRVFKSAGKGFVIYAVVLVAAVLCMEFDAFGYERRVPAPEKVETAQVSYYYGNMTTLESEETIAELTELHREIVGNKKSIERVIEGWDQRIFHMTVRYHLKNGGEIVREYGIPEDLNYESPGGSLSAKIEGLLNRPEAILSRHGIAELLKTPEKLSGYLYYWHEDTNVDIPLTSKQIIELYETGILPDMLEGKLGTIGAEDKADRRLELYVMERVENYERRRNSIFIGPDAERTVACLQHMGVLPLDFFDKSVEWPIKDKPAGDVPVAVG